MTQWMGKSMWVERITQYSMLIDDVTVKNDDKCPCVCIFQEESGNQSGWNLLSVAWILSVYSRAPQSQHFSFPEHLGEPRSCIGVGWKRVGTKTHLLTAIIPRKSPICMVCPLARLWEYPALSLLLQFDLTTARLSCSLPSTARIYLSSVSVAYDRVETSHISLESQL